MQFFPFAEDEHASLAVIAVVIEIGAENFPIAAADKAFRREIVKQAKSSIDRDKRSSLSLTYAGRFKRGNLVAD